MNYEPPATEIETVIDFAANDLLAPNVAGYASQVENEIWISDIRAVKEGNGDVGRFLESLSPRCCVVNVISKKLAGMLMRRNFVPENRPCDDGEVDVWKRIVSG